MSKCLKASQFTGRFLLALMLVFTISLLFTLPAIAGGWWQIGSSLDPIGSYWWDQGEAEIYTMNTNGTSPTLVPLTTVGSANIQPAFNPAGDKIAFSSNRDGNYEIYLGTLSGLKTAFTAQSRLTNDVHDDMEPAFNPAGTKIAFTTNRDGNNEIYVMNADGTGQTRLTNDAADDREAAFSNDGLKIVFSSNRSGNYQIYSMNSDGSGVPSQLTFTAGQHRQPKWSPATIGGFYKIAYTTNVDGDYDIHQMNTDGTGDVALTNNTVFNDIQPSYSPDASTIAFATDRDGSPGASYEIYTMLNDGSSQLRRDGSSYVDFMPSYYSSVIPGSVNKIAFVSNRSGITSPHDGYSTTTNLCKTCHAVHLAGGASYRLLKNGTTTETRSPGEGSATGMGNARATECMYCHDADSGSSAKKPYILGVIDSPKGEHSLGATKVPDSNINGGINDQGNLANRDPFGEGAVLQCYQCHSVHGANTVGGPGYSLTGWVIPPTWDRKILRLDPSGDGVDLAQNDTGTPSADYGVSYDAVKSGWCSDCHNQNPNWMNAAQTGTDADYPNPRSHPINTDGQMEVYGDMGGGGIGIVVSGFLATGCQACHSATVGAGLGTSRFPHQSLGHKLLNDNYTTLSQGQPNGSPWYTGDPQRALPQMDWVCIGPSGCHAGLVGKTF